jgi:hypothetical protein
LILVTPFIHCLPVPVPVRCSSVYTSHSGGARWNSAEEG